MRILIIDDDQALTTIFESVFKKEGYEVVIVHDGTNGLETAKNGNFDLILLDQILPDTQGNEVLKTLKSEPQTKSIPVAILSNFGQNELIQEAIKNGAIDYILKYQVEPQDLINKVKSLLKEAEHTKPS